jgi:hypothetical protein
MRRLIGAILTFFIVLMIVVWVVAERTDPVMLGGDQDLSPDPSPATPPDLED